MNILSTLTAYLMLVGIDLTTFLSAAGPILAVIISGIFTWLGVMLNNRAKAKDQALVAQAQEFDAVKVGQGYLKDSLEDARIQIVDLKKENHALEEQIRTLEKINEKLQETNRKLELLSLQHERKINTLEDEVRVLKEKGKNNASG